MEGFRYFSRGSSLGPIIIEISSLESTEARFLFKRLVSKESRAASNCFSFSSSFCFVIIDSICLPLEFRFEFFLGSVRGEATSFIFSSSKRTFIFIYELSIFESFLGDFPAGCSFELMGWG